jgi:hypothetical protein
MGYSTDYSGELKFVVPLSSTELGALNLFMGADPRDHKEWNASNEIGYIDLELTKDFSGIKWDGAEKNRGMVEAVNLIVEQMKKIKPDFALTGAMQAQGEDIEDRWSLVIDGGIAKRVETPPPGEKIKCPHCEEYFYYEKK